jgi:hypothetical protein
LTVVLSHVIDIVALGSGFYPFLWFLYLLFALWNTFDVISLRVMNHPLLHKSEQFGMPFGQILPLVLILALVLGALDEYEGRRPWQKFWDWFFGVNVGAAARSDNVPGAPDARRQGADTELQEVRTRSQTQPATV